MRTAAAIKTETSDVFPPFFEMRVYYEDTDAAGVVYYANYLRFAERARSEWMRSAIGADGPLWRDKSPQFVVRHVEAEYFSSAFLDDKLSVKTELVRLGGASMRMVQTILRGKDVLNKIKVTLVCIAAPGKVLRIPAEWRQKLEPYLQQGA